METKQFNFGGLEVTLYKHEICGWVTTPRVLAKAIGLSLRGMQRNINRYGVIDDDRGVSDEAFTKEFLDATNLSRPENEKHASKMSTTVLTVKGMIFLTQLARTIVADRFRKEVLETVEGVESMGHANYQSLHTMVLELQEHRKQDRALIEALIAENKILRRASTFHASAAAYEMNARKVEKQITH